jgi:hypothetical protein
MGQTYEDGAGDCYLPLFRRPVPAYSAEGPHPRRYQHQRCSIMLRATVVLVSVNSRSTESEHSPVSERDTPLGPGHAVSS